MCSGAIVKMKYPEAELIGINYGQQFPFNTISKDDMIFMVDFSLQPFEEMIKLHKIIGNNLIWIDHHKSSLEDYEKYKKDDVIGGIIKGFHRNDCAGCELTWEYLYPNKEMPTAVYLLGRYDVWYHKDPRVLPFQMGIRLKDAWPTNQSMWVDYFGDRFIDETISDGYIVLKYQEQENEKFCKATSFEILFEGYKAIVMNKQLTNSQAFKSIWDNEKYDIMIVFGLKSNGLWTFSFYTDKEGIDVSILARKLGGGGHAQAAGCNFKELPIEFLRQIKKHQRDKQCQ